MAQPNLKIIDLDSDEEEEENGQQENICHRTESPEMLVITKQRDTQQLPILENANKKEELVRGPKYGESEKGKELQLEPQHLVEKNRQSPEKIVITKQGETQQHPILENANKKGELGMEPWYCEREKQLQLNPQHLAEKDGQPQRPKPWNPDKGTKHWNDKYDKKKLPWGQRQKSSEKSYESQKQEVTEKVTLKFKFDKGQTRCYNKNSNLSKKVTKLQSEYLKDKRDNSDNFNISEENECLLIEIIGEESFGKGYFQQLQQLKHEMWTGSFDLFRISKEESDVALMSHGLQPEFIAKAEGSLACGIMVEKSSERVKHFLSSPDHCFDENILFKRSSVPQFPPSEDHKQQKDADQLTIRNSTIHVVNKDITQYKAKCLVNFFDKKSDLSSKGVLFRRFMERGGNDMYQYLRNNYCQESVTVTQSSGDLSCQYVLHVALSEYQEGSSLKELQKIVRSCFTWCESLGDLDIAFPSLGVGHLLRYPVDGVADVLIKESISMAEQGNKWKISFAVYDNDSFMIFKQRLLQTPGKGFHAPHRSYSTPDLGLNLPTPMTRQKPGGQDQGRRPDPPTPMTRQRPGGQDEGRRPDTAHRSIHVPKIELYAISKEEGVSLRSELSRMIKEKYLHEHIIKDIKTGELSKENKKSMYAVGQKHGVFVSLDKDKNCIILKGISNNVSKAATEIGSICYSASSAVVPTRRKENRHQRGTTSYWKHLLEENPVPGYWKFFQDGKSFFDIFKGIFTTTEKVYKVDPKTFHAIRKLVEDTFNPEFVGVGADAKNLKHKRLRVQKVEIIENLDLFRNYNIKRCKMLGNSMKDKRGFPCKLEKIPRVEGIQNVVRKGGILTEKDISKRLMKDIIPELNEVYLFHGTKKDFVANIISKGVDPKLGSDEGMFGRGVYCCESSTKADQYADDIDKRGTKGKMFLMRFLLGHMYLTEKPNKYKLPPCYHCRKDGCRNQSHQGYDSVVGVKQQSGGLFREFVVYEKDQCYPEYLITYTREN